MTNPTMQANLTYPRTFPHHAPALTRREMLVRGGFILFDDSADGSEWEVCRVVREIKAAGRHEVVIQNPNYLFVKK